MSDRLSAADRGALTTEKGPINMAMLGVIILEAGPGVGYAAIRDRVAERIHLLPRYRQRLVESSLGVTHPVWVDDEHFEIGWHVRSVALPAPGGEPELADWVAGEASRRMDRTRPLWELHVIEGLSEDRVAIVAKMHHALVDGLGAVGIAMVLVDPTPEPLPIDPPDAEWLPRRHDPKRELLRAAAGPLTGSARVFAKARRRALDRVLEANPLGPFNDARRAAETLVALGRLRPEPPLLPFNRSISPNRSYAMTRFELAPLKQAAKANGATINDAILTAVSGMLAGYLAAAGIELGELGGDPVALVPVSARERDDERGGNQIAVVMVELPVAEPDPLARLAAVHLRMEKLKGSAELAAGALRVEQGGIAPPFLASMLALAPALGGRRMFNLVVSNVPGPQIPLWINGSSIQAVHPVVPLNPADQGLNVGVFSYNGTICCGIGADRDLDPPVELARQALDAAIVELRAAAGS